MTIGYGKNMRVFVEQADGSLYQLDGTVTDVQVNYRADLVDVSTYGSGSPEFITGRRWAEFEIRGLSTSGLITTEARTAMKTSSEWKCTYCGRPNKRSRETCKSCGAVRSFLYG